MHQPFVGRARELGVLRSSVDAAAAGQPAYVLVEGEGGCGKTSLLHAFTDLASQADVVIATGDEAEARLPYGVLSMLMRQLTAERSLVESPTDRGADPFVVGAAFLQMLGQASRSKPLVLMMDDADLADLPSLAALTFAFRRIRAEPVVLVLAAREDAVAQLPPGVLRLVDDHGTRVKLGGLSVEEIRQLGQATGFGRLSTRAATRLREHTAGNALHVRTLLSELTLDQAEAIDEPLPVPRSFALLVLATIQAASAPARELAAAAAVLGIRSTLSAAATVAGVHNARAVADELTRAHIIQPVESPDGTALLFTHPLIQAAVYDDIGLADRARLHARAAALCPGEEGLRHRVAAADGPDPALVEALKEQAQQDRRSGQLAAAATALRSASRLIGPGPESDGLLLDAVDLQLQAGDVAAALAHAAVLEHMPPSAHRLHVQARMAWLSGQFKEADALGQQAWTQAAELDPLERDLLAAMLSQLAVLRNDGVAAPQWTDRALASGLLPGEVGYASQAAGALGLAMSGKVRQGLARLADLPADPAEVPLDRRPLLYARANLRLIADDLDATRDDLQPLLPSAGNGVGPLQLTALGMLVDLEYRAGAWDSSLALGEQLVGLVEDTDQSWLEPYARAMAMLTLAGRGQWERAETYLGVARQSLRTPGHLASRAYSDAAAVHLAYCRGDSEAVVAASHDLTADAPGPSHEPGVMGWPPQYLTALVDLHRLDEAETALGRMDELAFDRRHRSRQAALARVRGELEAARRRTTEARAAFQDAIRLGDGAADALESAVAHAAYGRFLRRRGERRSAVEHLQNAWSMFTRLGAAPFLGRCEAELAACGQHPARGAADTVRTMLTPQELAVAQLVSQGRRNQEIADELVLSVKTISYHLRNVYSKVGVRSRTELAAKWQPTAPGGT